MKRFLILLTILITIQGFSVQYTIIKSPLVTYSKETFRKENAELEKSVTEFSSTEGIKKMAKLYSLEHFKRTGDLVFFYNSAVALGNSIAQSNVESSIKIEKIEYISNTKAKVTLKSKIKDISLLSEKEIETIRNTVEQKVEKKIGYSLEQWKNKITSQKEAEKVFSAYSEILGEVLGNKLKTVKQTKIQIKSYTFEKIDGKWRIAN
ncbi:hypothetical protein EII29_06165 [Leptotrichia sp. OH3620_COT-345]|uniref:hypothetical protein n=1 Tax=Leptotrichia sp. OH3620_COT-345 TaxID=2491048 RepID=UPI000F64FB09|nr:hypothetical protein [Leptotrichia sp. OH3620_COT-345]RRD39620.1 hypothetical protein EII29_06165 [Leptotrichia sp. OH3620_COT-345]